MTDDNDREAAYRASLVTKCREMSLGELILRRDGARDRRLSAYAEVEIRRREAEEQDRVAKRQQWTAWAAVAAAGLAAIATVALAVIAWMQRGG